MTLFTHRGHTCPVSECPRNRGERGLSCGWAGDPIMVCKHPIYRARWEELTALEQDAPEPEPVPAQLGLGL